MHVCKINTKLLSFQVPLSVSTVEITPTNFEPYIAISTFEAQNRGELSVHEGDLVTIKRPCDTSGNSEWWLVTGSGETGYVPSSFLEKYSEYAEQDDDDDSDDDGEDERKETMSSVEEETKQSNKASYYAQFEFEGTSSAEISLDEGQIVTVLQHHDLHGNTEWWLVATEGKKGYVAANFLAPLEDQ